MSILARCERYRRSAYIATVKERDRSVALRLCRLFEAIFPAKERHLYSGMPVAIRDMEWLAGFAMRASHPVAYCCSPGAMKELKAELAPYLSGKSCIAVKPRRGESLDGVLELVGRAFRAASRHGGMISKVDARARVRSRGGAEPKAKASSKRTPAASKRARKSS